MAKKLRYDFQFNGDVDSCLALASLIKDGWAVETLSVGDGFTWMHMEKWVKV
jgi:hypothetical protein